MKPFLRMTLIGATMLSAALFVAMCSLLVRSYFKLDLVGIPISSVPDPHTAMTPFGYSETFNGNMTTSAYVASSRGKLWFRWKRRWSNRSVNRVLQWRIAEAVDVEKADPDCRPSYRHNAALGFSLCRGMDYLRLGLPEWFLAGITAILPLARLSRKMRARRRAKANLCVARGYDLRASPNRCPECGAVPKSV
jgi:hypothetical protein